MIYVIKKENGYYFHPLNLIAGKQQASKFNHKTALAQVADFNKYGYFGKCTIEQV